MCRTPWVTYLWPGLPQIWRQGSWLGLIFAFVAAALLNLALIGSFGFGELVAQNVRMGLWVVLGAVWVVAAAFSYVSIRREATPRRATTEEDIFSEATEQYLKGNWYQAERLLGRLLGESPRDLEARLMLATLLRHTKRPDEAAEQLDLLTRLEGAQKWELEIQRERELLDAVRNGGVRGRTETEPEPSLDATDPPAEMIRAA